MKARVLSALLAISFAGTSSSAQGIDPRLASRLDAKTRTAISAIIDSARIRSLPVEPLIDKALEGAAKKAASQQIVAAVRTYSNQLDQARSALGESSSAAELVGGAQALRAGIPVSQLQKLRKTRPGVQIATALTVLSDIVSREVPIDTAVTVVASLIDAAATDEQLLGVRGEIETDILAGKQPALAASSRAHALAQTLAVVPNGAPGSGALPSPSGTSRAGDGTGLNPPPRASGSVGAPVKPPASQRKKP
jgi:hypothetical protein